jgi:hypothetical protein
MVHPCQSGVVFENSFVDPVPCLKAVSVGCRIPWDTHYNDFSTVPVGGVVGHPEGLEAFPCPAFWVPKIFDLGVARIDNGASFTETTYSRGRPIVLRMRRLLKMSCLRTSAWDAGSDFVRPTLILS